MDDQKPRLGTPAFVIAGMSFIPLIGVVFGLIAVAWAIFSRKQGRRKLALIGASGICCTFVLYGGLIYFGFVQRGGIYDNLRGQLAQSNLDSLVPVIEFYKLQHGIYPESLNELRDSWPKGSALFIGDPTQRRLDAVFYYERVGSDHYYLRSVGPDGVPFTADDIVPRFQASEGKIGLLTEPPGAPAKGP